MQLRYFIFASIFLLSTLGPNLHAQQVFKIQSSSIDFGKLDSLGSVQEWVGDEASDVLIDFAIEENRVDIHTDTPLTFSITKQVSTQETDNMTTILFEAVEKDGDEVILFFEFSNVSTSVRSYIYYNEFVVCYTGVLLD